MAKKKVSTVKKAVKNDNRTMVIIFAAVFAVIGFAALANTYAAKGGNGNGGGGNSNATLRLVLLEPGATEAHFGDQVTFDVQSASHSKWVEASCMRNNEVVYVESRGFFPEYPWGQTYTLGPTAMWTSGAASCKAELFSLGKNQRHIVEAMTSFNVAP